MTLKQKLLTALAGTTSQAPIDTATLAQGHFRCRVADYLRAMLQSNEVCHCKITKPNQSPVDVWWLAGNTENAAMNYNQTLRANKRAKARAAKLLDGDGDE